MELELRLTRAEVEALRARLGDPATTAELMRADWYLDDAWARWDANDNEDAQALANAHNAVIRRLRAQLKEAAPAAAMDRLK